MFPLDIATRPFVDRRLFSKYTHGRVKSNRLIWIKKRIACPPWSRLPKYNTLLILDLISWNYRFLFLYLLFQIIGNLINFLPYYFTDYFSDYFINRDYFIDSQFDSQWSYLVIEYSTNIYIRLKRVIRLGSISSQISWDDFIYQYPARSSLYSFNIDSSEDSSNSCAYEPREVSQGGFRERGETDRIKSRFPCESLHRRPTLNACSLFILFLFFFYCRLLG